MKCKHCGQETPDEELAEFGGTCASCDEVWELMCERSERRKPRIEHPMYLDTRLFDLATGWVRHTRDPWSDTDQFYYARSRVLTLVMDNNMDINEVKSMARELTALIDQHKRFPEYSGLRTSTSDDD